MLNFPELVKLFPDVASAWTAWTKIFRCTLFRTTFSFLSWFIVCWNKYFDFDIFGRLDFRRFLVSGLPSPRRTGEERGLISRKAAGNRAYQNLSKVSKGEGFSREDFKLAHCQKSEICLETENSDPLSDRVCHSCARKRRNAFGLHNFIYSSLQKAKQAAIEVPKQEKDIKHQKTLPCCEVQR